jgi:hypothetical protein
MLWSVAAAGLEAVGPDPFNCSLDGRGGGASGSLSRGGRHRHTPLCWQQATTTDNNSNKNKSNKQNKILPLTEHFQEHFQLPVAQAIPTRPNPTTRRTAPHRGSASVRAASGALMIDYRLSLEQNPLHAMQHAR